MYNYLLFFLQFVVLTYVYTSEEHVQRNLLGSHEGIINDDEQHSSSDISHTGVENQKDPFELLNYFFDLDTYPLDHQELDFDLLFDNNSKEIPGEKYATNTDTKEHVEYMGEELEIIPKKDITEEKMIIGNIEDMPCCSSSLNKINYNTNVHDSEQLYLRQKNKRAVEEYTDDHAKEGKYHENEYPIKSIDNYLREFIPDLSTDDYSLDTHYDEKRFMGNIKNTQPDKFVLPVGLQDVPQYSLEGVQNLSNEPIDLLIKRYCLDISNEEVANENNSINVKMKEDTVKEKDEEVLVEKKNEEDPIEKKNEEDPVEKKNEEDPIEKKDEMKADMFGFEERNLKTGTSFPSSSNKLSNNMYTIKDFRSIILSILEKVLDVKLCYIRSNIIPNLRKVLYYLKEDYNDLIRGVNRDIISLKLLVNTDIRNADSDILVKMGEYLSAHYDTNQTKENIYYSILLYRSHEHYVSNKKGEIHSAITKFIDAHEKSLNRLIYLGKLARILIRTLDNFTNYQVLFNMAISTEGESIKLFSNLLQHVVHTLKNVEELYKSGFIIKNKDKLLDLQKKLSHINHRTLRTSYGFSDSCIRSLSALNLSKKDYKFLVISIFYYINRENAINMAKLKEVIGKYEKNSMEELFYNFVLKEGEKIEEFRNLASKAFNIKFDGSYNKQLNNIIKDPFKSKYLYSAYLQIKKLIRTTYFHNQIVLVSNIFNSLKKMNLNRQKYVSRKTGKILIGKIQSKLLSDIEVQKAQVEEVKSKIEYALLIKNFKENIFSTSVVIGQREKELQKMISILTVVRQVLNEGAIDSKRVDKTKRIDEKNILLSYLYINKMIDTYFADEMI